MFPSSTEEQYKKVIEMLNVMVTRLERKEQLTDEVTRLARRRVEYGVKAWHYELVGDALLWPWERARDVTGQ